MKKLFFAISAILFTYSCFSQGRTIAFKVTINEYNTYRLNFNGVAIKSVIIVGDSTSVRNALYGKGAKYFSYWLDHSCSYMLLSLKQVEESYPAGNFKRFTVEQGKLYLIMESSKDFIKTFNSFAIGKIPPPVLPPNKEKNQNKSSKHVEFCEPEQDACISLCVKKTEASYEVCCDDVCLVIKYDGSLTLSAEVSR